MGAHQHEVEEGGLLEIDEACAKDHDELILDRLVGCGYRVARPGRLGVLVVLDDLVEDVGGDVGVRDDFVGTVVLDHFLSVTDRIATDSFTLNSWLRCVETTSCPSPS